MISKGRIFVGTMLLLGLILRITSAFVEYLVPSVNLSWLWIMGTIMIGIGLVGYLFFVVQKIRNQNREKGDEGIPNNTDATQK